MVAAGAKYFAVHDQLLSAFAAGDLERVRSLRKNETRVALGEVGAKSFRLREINNEIAAQMTKNVEALYSSARTMSVIVSLVTLGFVVAICLAADWSDPQPRDGVTGDRPSCLLC